MEEASWRPENTASLFLARKPTAAWLTLREIAGERVDTVAEKMKAMREEELEEMQNQLIRLIMKKGLDDGGGHHVNGELKHLQRLVQGRVDFTPDMLRMAHPVQLALLVAIETGTKGFVDRSVAAGPAELADVLLSRRCQNLYCFSVLPADDGYGEGDMFTVGKGFCSYCMCVICNKFDDDSELGPCVRCDVCAHFAHTDCAISDGQIGFGQPVESDMGYEKIIFHCQVCQGTSELLKSTREVFQAYEPYWARNTLLRECESVCKIFHGSKDPEERKFFRKCAELLASFSSDVPTCCTMQLQELQEMDNTEEMRRDLERILIDTSAEPIELSYAFLESITNDFSVSQVIGRGGFGEVYMGGLQNKKIAVKKLFQTMDFSDKQFQDELTCLKRVKHKNIVRFLGYCSDTKEEMASYKGRMIMAEVRRRFLCFEYVPNKNLHDYLKDESHGHEWDTRCKLIEGICHGLRYLHNNERITHLDLKPENILLDADMVPKITDFGLSRRFSGEQSRIITKSSARGTPGYIAPEYWSKGEISYKADIYSLGIIIRKLFCGSTDPSDLENWYHLMVSPQVKRCIKISRLCVDDNPRKRPTIDCVIEMLSEKETMTEMLSPVFCHLRNNSVSSKEQGYFGSDTRCQRSFVNSGYSSGECIGFSA